MKIISVKEANYIDGFKVEILFTDDKKSVIDFSIFFLNHSHPQYNKYKNPENFKKFKIENGNIVWGKNWDMIFPVYDLYNEKIN
jgi:hypothetical protein